MNTTAMIDLLRLAKEEAISRQDFVLAGYFRDALHHLQGRDDPRICPRCGWVEGEIEITP